ncbi:glutaminase [Microbacterium betulae]|uniref:Glutaminase n=1 Tax=Microbacterium betulae TaxID=2981139 RepID=A0AA97I553_9MICO|nr:glutaminase [Microbacterium sp. AB]WOF22454.1 glutaminase [Microbacterium sp. AB]
MDDLRALLDDARSRLADVPRESTGGLVEPGRVKRAIGVRPRIVRVGEVWRLGVLLLGDDGVWATGEVLRAAEEVRRGYPAESQRRRAEVRAMAFRGGFAEGETFHIGWAPVDVAAVADGGDDGPLSWDHGTLMVRWSPAGFFRPLAPYLSEQIGLLRRPGDG